LQAKFNIHLTLQELRRYVAIVLVLSVSAGACTKEEVGIGGDAASHADGQATGVEQPVRVQVLLDGELTSEVLVMQGGHSSRWTTGPAGDVEIMVDLGVPGDLYVIAAHEEARVKGKSIVPGETDAITIELTRYDPTDNESYTFRDPGEPGESHIIEKCAHCHLTIAESWFDSAHRLSAKNPLLLDVYGGTASGYSDAVACAAAGGSWETGTEPGTGGTFDRCVVTSGALEAGPKGGCADCHAPGIDGELGGRDLYEARDYAYDYGVHCDVCHRVESIDMNEPPGVAGRLHLHRPGESPKFEALGEFAPLTFCPNPDVPNIYMGCVPRDHFRSSEMCGGCHEQDQEALVEGTVIDLARWPSGMIPVHSTFSEWQQSPMAAGLACQGCHMPPADPSVTNGADLQAVSEASTGITAGWPRPPGSTRLHTWAGPKSPQDARLPSPLTLQLEKGLEQGVLTASVTVTNVGAGHAIPTGEPMRAVVVLVEAYCEETPLVATGGDSVSDIGGALDWREADQGFDTWPGAKVGEVIRVVSRSGERVDYEGFGPFGDGTFSLEEKGLWVEQVVGQSVITAIDGETVSLSAPLPLGDRAYRASSDAWAGLPGFAFARVLVGPDGQRMVPHFRAVDVVSDNRLLPGKSWTSNHAFISTCEAPTIEVRVMGRAVPLYQSRLHGWELRDTTLSTLTE
jgi:hypothetical protein